MRRIFAALALAAIGIAAFPNAVTPNAGASDTTSTAHHATLSSSSTGANSSTRWIAVGVGTLWVSRGGTRAVDRLIVSPPASICSWIATMTLAQKQWLVGRIETQALYGTAVTIISASGGWSRVVVPSQPTPRDRRGYPGWIKGIPSVIHAPNTGMPVSITPLSSWASSSYAGARRYVS